MKGCIICIINWTYNMRHFGMLVWYGWNVESGNRVRKEKMESCIKLVFGLMAVNYGDECKHVVYCCIRNMLKITFFIITWLLRGNDSLFKNKKNLNNYNNEKSRKFIIKLKNLLFLNALACVYIHLWNRAWYTFVIAWFHENYFMFLVY